MESISRIDCCEVNNPEIYRSGKLKLVLLKNSSTETVAGDGKVGVDSSRLLLRGLGANGAWSNSPAAAARVPAEGRNGLSSLSHDRQLGSNGVGENSPVEAAGGSAAGERIPGQPAPAGGPRTAAARLSTSAEPEPEAGRGRKKSSS